MTASSDHDRPADGRLLVVVRHGRAEPYAEEDHARVLTARGRREARDSGAWLAAQGLLPDHAFVSTAARTRGTWEELAEPLRAAGARVEPDFSDAVYAATADSAVDVLRTAPAEARVVLYVGHNPTAGSLPVLLDAGDPDPEAFVVVSGGFPTAAVAVLEVPVAWAGLDSGTSRLAACHVPQV